MRDKKPGQLGDVWLSRNRHGTWCRTWFDPKSRQTRRATLGTSDYDEAQLMLARWVVLNEQLDEEAPQEVPVVVVLERYWDRHGKHLASSAKAAKPAIDKLKAFFRDDVVSELTLDRQRAFELHLREQGLSDGYIGRIQTVLKAACNRSHKNHELASAPFVRVLAAGQRERVLTLQESAALFNANPPEHVLTFLMLAFNTLSRPEALLELQPIQADFEHRLMRLNPPGRQQTKKHRPTLPITDTLLPWLLARREQRYFVQWTKGQESPIGSLKTTWRRLRRDASTLLTVQELELRAQGLGSPGTPLPELGADVVPYTIRHTMATWMRSRGVPAWEVAGFLGHRLPGTTEVYAKFAPDYLSKAAAAIDDYMHELQPLVKRELIMSNVTALKAPRRS